MASRKSAKSQTPALTPRESADYTQGILGGLEKLARNNSHALLAHLLDMARREAAWLSKQ